MMFNAWAVEICSKNVNTSVKFNSWVSAYRLFDMLVKYIYGMVFITPQSIKINGSV